MLPLSLCCNIRTIKLIYLPNLLHEDNIQNPSKMLFFLLCRQSAIGYPASSFSYCNTAFKLPLNYLSFPHRRLPFPQRYLPEIGNEGYGWLWLWMHPLPLLKLVHELGDQHCSIEAMSDVHFKITCCLKKNCACQKSILEGARLGCIWPADKACNVS